MAASPDAVTEDAPLAVSAAGEEIAIYRVDEQYFATSNICTHGLARLSDGYLEGHLIECPLHQGVFDIRTGRCVRDPVDVDIKTYEVRLHDGCLEIRLQLP